MRQLALASVSIINTAAANGAQQAPPFEAPPFEAPLENAWLKMAAASASLGLGRISPPPPR